MNDGSAAIAVGCSRVVGSRCLARSRHRLSWQRDGINRRYRGACSHPAWQDAVVLQIAVECVLFERLNSPCRPIAVDRPVAKQSFAAAIAFRAVVSAT